MHTSSPPFWDMIWKRMSCYGGILHKIEESMMAVTRFDLRDQCQDQAPSMSLHTQQLNRASSILPTPSETTSTLSGSLRVSLLPSFLPSFLLPHALGPPNLVFSDPSQALLILRAVSRTQKLEKGSKTQQVGSRNRDTASMDRVQST